MEMDDTKGPVGSEAETDEAMERRDFMKEGMKLAAGAGVLGAMGLSAKPAGAAAAGTAASAQSCGPNPTVMQVTFDFHGTGQLDIRQIREHIARSGEQLSFVTSRMSEEGGWKDWPRDASGDDDLIEMRGVSYRQLPFGTGGR